MGYSIRPVRIDHDCLLQIEIANPPVRRRTDLVPQTDIERQIGTYTKIILDEFREIPVTGGVQTSESILLAILRHTEEQVSQAQPAISRGQISRVSASKLEKTTRRGHLIEV